MVTIKSPSCAAAYVSDQTSNRRRAQDFDVSGICRFVAVACALLRASTKLSVVWGQPMPQRSMRRRWEPFVKHEIDENAGDRDIEPNWDCPMCNPLVPVQSATKNGNQRQNNKGKRHEGQ